MGPRSVSYTVRVISFAQCVSSPHVPRCLAHVINLATQALLAAHSSAKHYNPANPTEHEPEVDGYLRDEIGLIRAIVVKVNIPPVQFPVQVLTVSFPRLVRRRSVKNVS